MAAVPPPVHNTPEEVEAWLLKSFETFDSRDVTRIGNVFSEKGELHFANNPAYHGLDEIAEFFIPSFGVLSHMKHVPCFYNKVDDKIWFTASISYRVKGDPDNETMTIPASALATLVTDGGEAGKLARFQVFLDNKPVAEKIEAVLSLSAEKEAGV